MMREDERDGLYKAIPTLEGDEAEESIRKTDETDQIVNQ